ARPTLPRMGRRGPRLGLRPGVPGRPAAPRPRPPVAPVASAAAAADPAGRIGRVRAAAAQIRQSAARTAADARPDRCGEESDMAPRARIRLDYRATGAVTRSRPVPDALGERAQPAA